jgi:anoctamin-10/anoctamin-7
MSKYNEALTDLFFVVGLLVLLCALLYFVIRINRVWKEYLKERTRKALEKRRLIDDKFREINGYSWDYVFVFKVYDEDEVLSSQQQKFNIKRILTQLGLGGFEIRMFYSVERNKVFCKVRVPIERLYVEADRIDMKLPCNPDGLKKLITESGRKTNDGIELWPPNKNLPDASIMTTMKPWDEIYIPFEYNQTDGIPPHLDLILQKWVILHLSVDNDNINFNIMHNTASPSVDGVEMSTLSDKHSVGRDTTYVKKLSEVQSLGNGIKHATTESLFRSSDRLKLIYSILNCHHPGGCYLDTVQLIRDKCVLSIYPLHDVVELSYLQSHWLNILEFPWKQDVTKVKNYFGEKIGLYFVFLGFYTTYLYIAALFGVIAWINVAVEDNDPNAPAIPYFAGFMSVWATLVLELWKRKEKRYALRWGMIGFEAQEQNRPAFVGEKRLSSVNGKPTLYFPVLERSLRSLKTSGVIMVSIICVIGVIALIFLIQIAMSDIVINGTQVGGIVGSILLAVQIQVLNYYYGELALKLNDYENHRTDTEYEDSLIVKTFLFQFVNSFVSLFYVAFLKPFLEAIDPCTESCMYDLQTMLATIFITRLGLGNVTEVGMPMITSFLERRKIKLHVEAAVNKENNEVEKSVMRTNSIVYGVNTKDNLNTIIQTKCDMSEVERSFLLPTYDVMLGPFEDYAEMVIQFGYTTMFIVAFPLATVMSLFNNYIELRVDAWKLTHVVRRPEPRSCEDIGSWFEIFEVISYAAVFVNSGLVAFTSTSAINTTWSNRVWIFVLMSFGLMGIKFLFQYFIPDISPEVTIQEQRNEYFYGKIVENKQDEIENEDNSSNRTAYAYTVGFYDDDPM